MSVSERMQLPKDWGRQARSAIEVLGAFLVIRRLTEWWPDHERAARVSRKGRGLLKHFIWMLDGPGVVGTQITAAHAVSVSCVCRALACEYLMTTAQAIKQRMRVRYPECYARPTP